MHLPKEVKLADIQRLLGAKTAERVLAAFLREKAGNVSPVTTQDIYLAREFVVSPAKRTIAMRKSFRKVAAKYLQEYPLARKAYLMWCSKVLAKEEPRRAKKARS